MKPMAALGTLLVCLLCTTGGGAITWLGSAALVNAARLTFEGQVVDAVVTDARVMQSRRGTSFEVRYAFSVPGDPARYTAEDETGRANLWETLADEPTWRAATTVGHVQVQYLPSDPHVNRPLAGTGASFGEDQAAGLGLGLCLLIPSVLVALGTVWGQIRRLRGR
jgi:hypothetical protein